MEGDTEICLPPTSGLETYFLSNSQTFASGFNLNSQIAVSYSLLDQDRIRYYSQGRNLYKLSQQITSWVLLESIDTKINKKFSKCEITCTSDFSSCVVITGFLLFLLFIIRPSSDGMYYGMVMSVRVSVRPTLRPSVRPGLRPSVRPFSALFSYIL